MAGVTVRTAIAKMISVKQKNVLPKKAVRNVKSVAVFRVSM